MCWNQSQVSLDWLEKILSWQWREIPNSCLKSFVLRHCGSTKALILVKPAVVHNSFSSIEATHRSRSWLLSYLVLSRIWWSWLFYLVLISTTTYCSRDFVMMDLLLLNQQCLVGFFLDFLHYTQISTRSGMRSSLCLILTSTRWLVHDFVYHLNVLELNLCVTIEREHWVLSDHCNKVFIMIQKWQ